MTKQKKEYEFKTKREWRMTKPDWLLFWLNVGIINFVYVFVIYLSNITTAESSTIKILFIISISHFVILYLLYGTYPYFKTRIIVREI